MRLLFFSICCLLPFLLKAQQYPTRFELSKGSQTPTYVEIIDWWKKLDKGSPLVKMQEMGPTDAGHPLHLILVSGDGDFHIPSLKRKNKTILFINNGIHPGEPDGIDASMLLVKAIVTGQYKLPISVVLAIIPVYNIGGALNRSRFYRVDQNGPEELGFRGNSQNLDLNRDFIKCDSKEALSFTKIFHFLDPDVFIDNHVSNGADYQHVMTLLTSQHNKLGGEMGSYLNTIFEPAIYAGMKNKGHDLVPYVNHFGETPETGWRQFWDSPRYSSGYATLWHTFAFVPETHMLKPYTQRVDATKDLMEAFIEFMAIHGNEIGKLRQAVKNQKSTQAIFPIAWKWDRTKFIEIPFKGYEGGKKTSKVSGLPRLYYDRSKPFQKKVPFYNEYTDSLSIEKPIAYIIPQGWWKVIERLKANSIVMQQFAKDTLVKVEGYRIEKYVSAARPYEGHHPNGQTEVSKWQKEMRFRKGDYYIPLNGSANRFLMETLEPQGDDSYFAWNFFDPILGQKEGFSDYAFEETAAGYLKNNPEIRNRLEERKRKDSSFAGNEQAQLSFVFQSSPYYEPAHMLYPVFRVVGR